MTGRTRNPDIDAAVLAATLAELRARPYRQLSIERIAVAAGVAKTSIYRRWPTKVSLVGNAILTAIEALPAAPATRSARDRRLALARHLRDVLAQPHLRRAVAGLLADAEDAELDPLRQRLLGLRTAAGDPTADDSASDAVAGAILYRSLVLRLPVGDDYLTGLVDLVTGPARRARR